jgi:chromosome segregation protein
MILKSIIIVGFKSFGKRVVIDVSHNVSGVVGPNGSGKSNVAEAIRFVLGEQSMKSMRGKHQSDLIFKGSLQLPALSRASVELKIENYKKDWNANASQDR